MSFSVSASQSLVYEGAALSFTIQTDQFASGTQLQYRLQGGSSNDVAGGQLSGIATLDAAGRASISFRLPADQQIDLTHTMSLEITGVITPGVAQLENAIQSFMGQYSIPGMSVAIAYNDHLVYARGFGYSDLATQEVVSPETLFRLASVSKPITSAIIMDLVEQGRFSLDQAAFPLLGVNYAPMDPRVSSITVRELLQMSGGWDRAISPDLVGEYPSIRSTLGVSGDITRDHILEYGLGHTMLDFTPGTRAAYSNFSYVFLGEIIERITGLTYEQAAQNVLRLAGITDMQIGEWSESGLLDNEAHYYQLVGSSIYSPIYSPYDRIGADWLSAIDSAGGWIGSAVDLMRFTTAIDNNSVRTDFLTPASVAELVARPSFAASGDTYWYGSGWETNTYNNAWHTGAISGTSAAIVRYSGGLQAVVIANTNADGFYNDQVFQMIGSNVGNLRNSPTDLFSFYDTPLAQRSATVSFLDTNAGTSVIDGTTAADRLQGTSSSERLFGYQGDDRLIGSAGNDAIDGGAGVDTSVYTGPRSQYSMTVSGVEIIVTDSQSARDGADHLLNVERLQFADNILAFDLQGHAGDAYRVYQAAFNRTPDQPGLSYWVNQMDRGMPLSQVALNFILSPEFTATYGNINALSDAAYVTVAYQNVLHRAPDQAGLNYWLNDLSHGYPRHAMLAAFSQSAENQANVAAAIQNGILLDLGAFV